MRSTPATTASTNYSGANEVFNPNFLQFRNQQNARAAQATVLLRF